MISIALLCVALLATDPVSLDSEPFESADFHPPEGAMYQALFLAVVEGAYKDGLSDEDLRILLTRQEGREYEYFVYACPICSPVVAALELYRSRPERFYGFKSQVNTFGAGLPPELSAGLHRDSPGERLAAIRLLLERWIEAYLRSRNLEPRQVSDFRDRLAAGRKEGERRLRDYREGGSAPFTAPALSTDGDCSVCNGAFEGSARTAGALLPPMPAP